MEAVDLELMIQEELSSLFGKKNLPSVGQIQFLQDNEPEFIEKNLKRSLKSWKIDNCNTPTSSPQSNRRCEALNGKFKRNYVFENCLDSAQIVLDQIKYWLEQSNTFAHQPAFEMKTRNKFYNLNITALLIQILNRKSNYKASPFQSRKSSYLTE